MSTLLVYLARSDAGLARYALGERLLPPLGTLHLLQRICSALRCVDSVHDSFHDLVEVFADEPEDGGVVEEISGSASGTSARVRCVKHDVLFSVDAMVLGRSYARTSWCTSGMTDIKSQWTNMMRLVSGFSIRNVQATQNPSSALRCPRTPS